MQRQPPVGKFKLKLTQAFTLVEVMAVIAVIAILITLALPGIGGLSASANSEVYANALIGALNQAKETAIQNKRYVTMCAVNALTVTTTANIVIPACVNNTTTWNSWVVYIDTALNSGTATQLISLAGNMVSNSITTSSTGYLVFNSLGLVTLNGTATPITPINFIVAAPGCRGNNGRQVTLSANGTIVVAKIGC